MSSYDSYPDDTLSIDEFVPKPTVADNTGDDRISVIDETISTPSQDLHDILTNEPPH